MRSTLRVSLGFLLFAALGGPIASAAESPARFYDPDGNELPFTTFAEVERFLESAKLASKEKMSAGTNKNKRKVLLRHGEQSARAILRTSYELRDTPGGGFVDSYQSELAAYKLAGLLGLETVPPVVRHKGGSLQVWIENATTKAALVKSGRPIADEESFRRQMMDMHVFDNLIANTDRNPGNVLIDGDGKVWFIDHTRSFAGQEVLKYPEKITGCSRGLWQRLSTVPDAAILAAVGPYVKRYSRQLLTRRRLLVRAIRELIESRGEENVIFDSP